MHGLETAPDLRFFALEREGAHRLLDRHDRDQGGQLAGGERQRPGIQPGAARGAGGIGACQAAAGLDLQRHQLFAAQLIAGQGEVAGLDTAGHRAPGAVHGHIVEAGHQATASIGGRSSDRVRGTRSASSTEVVPSSTSARA